jgi:hypothetical protein
MELPLFGKPFKHGRDWIYSPARQHSKSWTYDLFVRSGGEKIYFATNALDPKAQWTSTIPERRTKMIPFELTRHKAVKAFEEYEMRTMAPYGKEFKSLKEAIKNGCWGEIESILDAMMPICKEDCHTRLKSLITDCRFEEEERELIRQRLGDKIADWLRLKKAPEKPKVVLISYRREGKAVLEVKKVSTTHADDNVVVTKDGSQYLNFQLLANPEAARDVLNEVYPLLVPLEGKMSTSIANVLGLVEHARDEFASDWCDELVSGLKTLRDYHQMKGTK